MTAAQPDGCRACSAPTTLFLCSRCITTFRDMLTGLFRGPYVTTVTGQTKSGGQWCIERRTPGLLQHLAEAAIGQVRINDGGRRARRAGLVQYTDPKTASDGLGGTEGQRRLEQDAEDGKLALASVLRQGGINPKAARLLEDAHQILTDLVDQLAQHGTRTPAHFAAAPRASLPASFRMADWLTGQMSAVSMIEQAGLFYDRLDRVTRRIERAIDRPQQPRTCGPCPTIVGSSRQECATALEARHGQHEVTCPTCRQTYNTEQLITRTFNGLHYKTFTVRELVDTVLPRMEEPVPQKTLERWIRDDRVPVRGYNADGHQMVQLEDVRRVRAQRPRHAKQAG